MPLPIIILLLLMGLFWLWRGQHLRRAKILISIATLFLLLVSSPWLPETLLRPFEKPYTALVTPPKNLDFIVVLGCYHKKEANRPITSQVGSCSISRLLEAIRVQELAPESKIVLSSNGSQSPETNAEMMLDLALALGYERDRFIVSNIGFDTNEEAEALSSMLLDTNSVLVTQASHMHRALAIFAQYGVILTPAATDYRVAQIDKPRSIYGYYPKSGNVRKAETAFHEAMGNTWVWIKSFWQTES